jgi:hypothetical protein
VEFFIGVIFSQNILHLLKKYDKIEEKVKERKKWQPIFKSRQAAFRR